MITTGYQALGWMRLRKEAGFDTVDHTVNLRRTVLVLDCPDRTEDMIGPPRATGFDCEHSDCDATDMAEAAAKPERDGLFRRALRNPNVATLWTSAQTNTRDEECG